jgi:hypothetical protein
MGKLNMVLVQILKQDWPDRWQSFLPDIVAASKTNETLCENSMAILKLLSEEVFDFSRGELTQVRRRRRRQVQVQRQRQRQRQVQRLVQRQVQRLVQRQVQRQRQRQRQVQRQRQRQVQRLEQRQRQTLEQRPHRWRPQLGLGGAPVTASKGTSVGAGRAACDVGADGSQRCGPNPSAPPGPRARPAPRPSPRAGEDAPP